MNQHHKRNISDNRRKEALDAFKREQEIESLFAVCYWDHSSGLKVGSSQVTWSRDFGKTVPLTILKMVVMVEGIVTFAFQTSLCSSSPSFGSNRQSQGFKSSMMIVACAPRRLLVFSLMNGISWPLPSGVVRSLFSIPMVCPCLSKERPCSAQ